MPTNTTNYSFKKPVVGADEDLWGGYINDNLDDLDSLLGDGAPLHIDSTNNRVGVGTASPATNLEVLSGGTFDGAIRVGDTGSSRRLILEQSDVTTYRIGGTGTSSVTAFVSGGTAGVGTEAMRIDSSGNVLVGTTTAAITTSSTTEGVVLTNDYIGVARTSNPTAYFNRMSTDGDIAVFRKNGTTVGSIGTSAGQVTIGNGAVGLRFDDASPARIVPFNLDTVLERDNAIDLGRNVARFDDVYATNGTIQTSDRNEKQQIASLTDAEMQAAKAISALFKTFKWNDAVNEKGDAARKHAGVIAQDVQQAMADAGLNAGDYAFFISNTWWETQTEVPAVEAVAAQDAVYEDVIIPAVLDGEGNEIEPERTEQRLVSEAVDAVEAKDAYTRTDTYDTLEEAPEGATERTRLGIRYPELLAFIGAATEQRLASIEARLDAIGA